MYMKMKHTFVLSGLVAAGLLGVISPAMAQNVTIAPNDTSPVENYRRSMRVISFGFPAESIYYENKGQKVELTAGVGSLSSSLPMPKGEFLKLYKQTQIPIAGSDKMKSTYQEVGTIALIKDPKAILLLRIPEDLSKNKIVGKIFKDSTALHPKKSARVFNISKKQIAIRAGKNTLKVAVGESGIIPWKAMAFNSVAYQIGMIDKKSGGWLTVERSECVTHPEMRTFVFISGTTIENKETLTTFTFTDPVEDENGGDGDTP